MTDAHVEHAVDPGNPFVLSLELPSALSCAVVDTPRGQRTLLTIRCGGGTMTVLLEKASTLEWAAMLRMAGRQMSSLIVPDPGDSPIISPNGRQ